MAQKTREIPAVLYYATKILPWAAVIVVVWSLATGRDKELQSALRYEFTKERRNQPASAGYQLQRDEEDSACQAIRDKITDPDTTTFWTLTASGYQQITVDEIPEYTGSMCNGVRRMTRDTCTFINQEAMNAGFRIVESTDEERTAASTGGGNE